MAARRLDEDRYTAELPLRVDAPPVHRVFATVPGLLPLRGWAGKRALDVAASVILLLLTSPLLLVVAAAIKLTSPGPVVFRQIRVGQAGRAFWILKFRTMRLDAEQYLESDAELSRHYLYGDFKLTPALDPRVTKLGNFLRRASIDEMPQLFNVLRGEMSLVGPRPVRPDELAKYGVHERAYLSLRPGLSGLWQVSGRSTVRFPLRAELDAEYFKRCSLPVDLKILLKTPLAVIRARGAY